MTDYQTKAMITALKDISTQLKTINRNVNYVGRKLEMIDSTLQKHGIAIMPGAEATEEEIKQPTEYAKYVKTEDIAEWRQSFYNTSQLSDENKELVVGGIYRMLKFMEENGKIVNIDIQKGE